VVKKPLKYLSLKVLTAKIYFDVTGFIRYKARARLSSWGRCLAMSYYLLT
jgi:hypothetical protein